jgi:hypothetical protein
MCATVRPGQAHFCGNVICYRSKELHQQLYAGKAYRYGVCAQSCYVSLQPLLSVHTFQEAQTDEMHSGSGVAEVPSSDHALRCEDVVTSRSRHSLDRHRGGQVPL